MATTPIPSNSITAFNQSTAPVGWTKLTTFDDIAIRIVSGTGGSSITNRQSFTTLFANRTITGTFTSSYTVSPATPPGVGPHTHPYGTSPTANTLGPSTTAPTSPARAWSPAGSPISISPAGSSSSHTHSWNPSSSGTGAWSDTENTIDFAVNYVDVIIAQRN